MTPQDKIVSRLTAVFGEPRSENPELFVEEFVKALEPYSAEVLERAGDEIIRSATFWPKPNEIRTLADRHAAALFKPKWDRVQDVPPPTPEQLVRAAAVMAIFRRNMADKFLGERTKEAEARVAASKREFDAMQRSSPNDYLHRKPRSLTDRSRAMSGETE